MENKFDFDENMNYALENIGSVLAKNRFLMDDFKRKKYSAAFETYMEKSRPVFEAIERACVAREEEREKTLEEVVERFLADEEKEMKGMGKGKRNNYLDLSKLILALYTVPMILEYKLDISDAFADLLIVRWGETYPQFVFKKGTYEELVDGFVNKKYCYITTAVCETQNKPDECYELMMFRGFRDRFLSKESDGEALINQYYEVAPRILKAIDMKADRDVIYEGIWETHLKSCLKHIERGENDLCKAKYVHMVNTLEQCYLS